MAGNQRDMNESSDGRKPADMPQGNSGDAATRRRDRAAEQLRANLARRKAQARSRRAGEADQREGMDGQDD